MDLTLMNLRRYAIDNRVEIRFAEPGSDCECLISDRGLVKIPTHAENVRAENVVAAAESFEIIAQNKPQSFTRAALVEKINEAFKNRSFAPLKEED
ncbi:MAG TPA: hypothetical protein VF762_15675 [Blastocatellia bacterium]|jgi:hypothetical protein